MRVNFRLLVLCAVLYFALPGFASESAAAEEPQDERRRVTVSERYIRGPVFRFVMGTGYRALWKTEIELPVLDLANEAGGLTPTRRFGGLQTAVLGFKAGNGNSYTFRGTDKDPSAVLDPMLRDTVVQTVVQDQMAAQHPGGPAVVGVISEAAGVLTIRERMVVMPDDPSLGEFREEFGGMIGTFFEYPLPAREGHVGFHAASEIIDQKELYDRLSRGQADAVDVEAFLRARLLDLLLGDFDRHRKQWRWAKLPGNPRWQPIPEDRDMAFVRYDGAGPRVASLFVPILQNYSAKYPFIKGLTLHGWEQDRWLLAHLEWPQWEAIAQDLEHRITDDVIERALAELPAEYLAIDGERLRTDLSGRRDRIVEGARAFYRHLAKEVDVQASDVAEEVLVERSPDGSMEVQVYVKGDHAGAGPPVYRRHFMPGVTKEVRIYLRDGDDEVEVRGAKGPILLRVIAGKGEKSLDDSASGGTRVYDEGGSMTVLLGPGTKVDRSPYVPPESDSGFVDVEDVPPRDWGFDLVPFPQFSFQKDVGVFIGVGGIFTRFGFRRHAWSHRHKFAVGWASEAGEPRAQYFATLQKENSKLSGQLELSFSGIKVLRFYGFGNETDDSGPDSFFRVRNQHFRAAPSLQYSMLDDRVRLRGGLFTEFSRTFEGSRKVDERDATNEKIYGSGKFGTAGVEVQFQFDTRTTVAESESDLALPFHAQIAAGYPTGGFLFDVTTRLRPPIWNVNKTTGAIEGSLTGFYSLDEEGKVVLSLRAGGKQTFGRFPYFAAAYIGGSDFFSGEPTLRGFRSQRFAGEESVYANTEVHILLGRMKLIVPADVGVLGFADVGRVFVDGESSNDWHPSGGGGIWFAPLVRTNTISFTVAKSREDVLVYLRLGFHY